MKNTIPFLSVPHEGHRLIPGSPSPSKRPAKSIRQALGTVILLWLLIPAMGSWGQPFTIDQANDTVLTTQGYVIPGGSFVGQSFLPTFASLDVVELQMNVQAPNNTSSGSAFVRIRSASPAGAILGTSSSVTITNPNPNSALPTQLVHFDFLAPLALTPLTLHVLEVVHDGGTGLGVFTSGFNNNTYADGAAFFQGASQPNADLFFREGTSTAPAVPEPSTMLLFGSGIAGLVAWRYRKSVKV